MVGGGVWPFGGCYEVCEGCVGYEILEGVFACFSVEQPGPTVSTGVRQGRYFLRLSSEGRACLREGRLVLEDLRRAGQNREIRGQRGHSDGLVRINLQRYRHIRREVLLQVLRVRSGAQGKI